MKLCCRTRGRSRIAVMGLVLACGALALAAVAAIPALGASTVKVNSKITIVGDAGGAVFHGHVKSSRDACVKHRKVKLFKKRKGQDKLLGRDRTSRNGSWSIGTPRGTHWAPTRRR